MVSGIPGNWLQLTKSFEINLTFSVTGVFQVTYTQLIYLQSHFGLMLFSVFKFLRFSKSLVFGKVKKCLLINLESQQLLLILLVLKSQEALAFRKKCMPTLCHSVFFCSFCVIIFKFVLVSLVHSFYSCVPPANSTSSF